MVEVAAPESAASLKFNESIAEYQGAQPVKSIPQPDESDGRGR
jgi:hypothetical protein